MTLDTTDKIVINGCDYTEFCNTASAGKLLKKWLNKDGKDRIQYRIGLLENNKIKVEQDDN